MAIKSEEQTRPSKATAADLASYRTMEKALAKVEGNSRSIASDVFLNIAPNNVSVRDGYSRRDYESFRPDEALPTKPKEIILAAMRVYESVSLVRNVVDLMGDFTVKGLDIVHPNSRIESFYKEWWKRVQGPERSERFANYLYRHGNVIVKRQTAKLPVGAEQEMRRAHGAKKDGTDLEADPIVPTEARTIPWKYTFLNPLVVELQDEDLSIFVGPDQYQFQIAIPDRLLGRLKKPKAKNEKRLVGLVPMDVRTALDGDKKVVLLDPDKIRTYYYKRDDWRAWAQPMTAAVLSDLQVLQKLKLADLAALDGAISSIRVWKLGNLDAKIFPSEATILRLAEILNNNVGGGVMDLVWGPDLELVETSSTSYKFLGEAKYVATLNAIYAGLGIPPTLTGADTKSGFTNNYISLKTLIERLLYGRNQLQDFWEYEIRLVQKAMGFRFPAQLVFDDMLADETGEKQLMLHMADRNLISIEAIQERFGLTPEIEAIRIRREEKKRKLGQIAPKAGPFHDSQVQDGIKKIFAQSGSYSPSELGVELEDKKPGEAPPAKIQADLAPPAAPKGQLGQGRPKGKKDKSKRKQKKVKPRTAAFLESSVKAEASLAKVAALITPAFMKSIGKKSLREMSDAQAKEFETLKLRLLCQFPLGTEPTKESVKAALKTKMPVPRFVTELVKGACAKFIESNDREPPVEILRRFQASAFAVWETSNEGSGPDNGLPAVSGATEESNQSEGTV